MRQTKVAQRYAKALFDLALETGLLEEIKNDLDTITNVKHGELQVFLVSPVIRGDQKTSVFDAIFAKHVQPLTTAFFKLVFSKGRSVAAKEIMQAFVAMYQKHKGVQVVELTTAVSVSEEVKESIKKVLQQNKMLENKTIELKETVDPSIIGGLIVQVDDKLFDASIRHDLQHIKRQFVKNMYVQELG